MEIISIAPSEIPIDGLLIINLLVESSIAETKKEARQLLSRGLVKVDEVRVGPEFKLMPFFGSVIIEAEGFRTVKLIVSE